MNWSIFLWFLKGHMHSSKHQRSTHPLPPYFWYHVEFLHPSTSTFPNVYSMWSVVLYRASVVSVSACLSACLPACVCVWWELQQCLSFWFERRKCHFNKLWRLPGLLQLLSATLIPREVDSVCWGVDIGMFVALWFWCVAVYLAMVCQYCLWDVCVTVSGILIRWKIHFGNHDLTVGAEKPEANNCLHSEDNSMQKVKTGCFSTVTPVLKFWNDNIAAKNIILFSSKMSILSFMAVLICLSACVCVCVHNIVFLVMMQSIWF